MAAIAPDTVTQTWPDIRTFHPLDFSRKEVRFLQITASDGELTAQNLHLVCKSLKDRVDYFALSYPWGSPSQPHFDLTIDGHVVRVRETVFQFFRALYHHLTRRTGPFNSNSILVWIDIICINQRDIQERNQQITLFEDIYRGARTVLAWVGQPDSTTEWMAAALLGNSAQLPISLDRMVESFMTYMSQPLWTRLWIKQELILCQRPIFFWGSHCAYSVNQQAPLFVQMLRQPRKPEAETYANLYWDLSRMRSRLHDSRDYARPYMSELVKSFASAGCSDPRDKIFALRAVAADGRDYVIDYSISATETAWRAIRAFDFDINGTQKPDEPEPQVRVNLGAVVFGAMGLTFSDALENTQPDHNLVVEGRIEGIVSDPGDWIRLPMPMLEGAALCFYSEPSRTFYLAPTTEGKPWASSTPLLAGDRIYRVDSGHAILHQFVHGLIVRGIQDGAVCVGRLVFPHGGWRLREGDINFAHDWVNSDETINELAWSLWPMLTNELCACCELVVSSGGDTASILGRGRDESRDMKFLVDRSFLVSEWCSRVLRDSPETEITWDELNTTVISPIANEF